MPFYKNWGFALVVIWFVTFFVNWAVFGGDPFGLIFLELGFTFAWLVAWLFVRHRGPHDAPPEHPDQMPVHLWIVTGLAVICYGLAAYSYVVSHTDNDVLAADAHSYQFISFPLWVDAVSACGVWVGLVASLLLPVRSRYSLPAFAVSFASLLVKAVYVRALWPTYDAQIFVASQNAVVALLFLLYAWYMHRPGRQPAHPSGGVQRAFD